MSAGAVPSPLESARFGVSFARLDPTATPNLEEALVTADADGVAVISARVDTLDLATTRRLEAVGFRLMDTLVYYRRMLSPGEVTAASGGHAVRSLGKDAVDACAAIAGRAFHDYLGHYHADERLDDAAADAAYADWIARLLAQPSPGQISLGVTIGGVIAGFIAGVQREDGGSEIVLNAVDPQHQGVGGYSALLSAYLDRAGARGDSDVIISTQLQNYGVQRVWGRAGFRLYRSFHTLHRWAPHGRA